MAKENIAKTVKKLIAMPILNAQNKARDSLGRSFVLSALTQMVGLLIVSTARLALLQIKLASLVELVKLVITVKKLPANPVYQSLVRLGHSVQLEAIRIKVTVLLAQQVCIVQETAARQPLARLMTDFSRSKAPLNLNLLPIL